MRTGFLALPVAALLVLAACNNDNNSGPTPTIGVAISGDVTVVQGQSGNATVTITRGGGYTGEVTLAVSGLPAGVTASLDPAAVPSGSTTSTLTLTASGTAATGTASYTVTGSGTGVTNATATGSVTVSAAPDFSLAVSPTSLSVGQGSSGHANITITRVGGFGDAVNLSVAGLPAGVTASFDNASPTGNSAALTLAVDAGAATGTTQLTINGTGAPGTRSTSLSLTVTPPGNFSLALTPTTLSVAAGGNGQATVTIAKTGSFTGNVTLSATGLPAGVTASFNPAAASPGVNATDVNTTSTMTLTVGSAVEVNDYTIVVHGTAEGQTEKTTELTLNVTAPVGGFTLSLNPTTLSVQAGANGQTTVSINKTGSFTGNVTLSATNLPAGVTASFNPAAASPKAKSPSKTDVQTQSTLTLTVDASAAANNYTVTVHGDGGSAVPAANVDLALTVTAAAGSFTLSANPATVSVQQGGTGQSTITINKTGSFTGDVALTVTGLPAGATGTFNPASASPPRSASSRRRPQGTTDVQTTSTLTVAAGGSVTVGSYPLVIHGNATGQTEQTTNVSVTVTAAGSNSSITFCNTGNLPVFFAAMNTGSAWSAVTGTTNADGSVTYAYNISAATGGIAWVAGTGTVYAGIVYYGTQAELQGIANAQCATNPNATRTLNGSVAGLGATDQASITMGGGTASASISTSLNFQLQHVLNGPADLIAVQSQLQITPFSLTPVGIIIRRGLDIADGGTIPVLDFTSGGEAFAPQTAQVTINNLVGDTPSAFMGYVTTTTAASFISTGQTASPLTVYGVPAAKQATGDLHQLIVFASSATPGDARGRFEWFKTLADRTVTLGDPLTQPTITSLGGSYPRYQATGPVQAIYNSAFTFSMLQPTATRTWTITATQGYVGGGGNYTMAMPDFSGLAGWLDTYALLTGQAVTTAVSAYGFSGGGVTPPNVEGGSANFASRGGSVTP